MANDRKTGARNCDGGPKSASPVRWTSPVRSGGIQRLRARFFAHHLESAEDEDQRRLRRDVHDMIAFPPTLPAHAAVHVDPDGWLWVQEYDPPWETGPVRWRVFDTEGIARAEVRTPRGLIVHEIGRDNVRGLWRDDFGVEYIRAYAITRSAPVN